MSSVMKKNILTLITLTAIIVAIHHSLLLGKFYGTGDMRDVFIPLETFFRQQQLQGSLPSWHPNVAWGFPVIAAGQIGFFYPPLLLSRFLPIWLYLPTIIILHSAATLCGTYYFIKQSNASKAASLLGATAFTGSAFIFQHITHLNIFLITAWLPWQYIAARAFAKKTSYKHLALLSLSLGLPFLVGQFQLPLWMAAITTFFFIYISRQSKSSWLQLTKKTALLTAIVAGIAAAQILPTIELMSNSSRGLDGDFDVTRANQHSYPLYHLPTLFFPKFFGSDDTYWGKRLEIEYGFFIGTLPLLLSIWMFRRAASPDLKWHRVLAIITFLLSLGELSPIRLFGLEPTLWIFSAPARWLLFTTFSLSVLAAHGFDHVSQHPASFYRLVRRAIFGVATAVAITNIALFNCADTCQQHIVAAAEKFSVTSDNKPPEYYKEKITDIISQARTSSVSLASPYTYVPLLVLITAGLATRKPHLWQRTVLIVSVAEILIIASTASPTVPWRQLLEPPKSMALLPDTVRSTQARIISVREGGDTGALFTDPASRANAYTRQQQKELLVPLLHSQFGIAGVEWPASLDLSTHGQALNSLREQGSYAITNEPLAAGLNIGAILVPNTISFSPQLAKPIAQTPDMTIFELPAKPRLEFIATNTAHASTLSYEYIRPTILRAHISTASQGNLIVRDTMYPGWRVTINGQKAAITTAENIFRAISVPAGTHTIEFTYMPKLLYAGIAISITTLLLIMALLTKNPPLPKPNLPLQ